LSGRTRFESPASPAAAPCLMRLDHIARFIVNADHGSD
jgi:hypothetical protein